MNNDNDSGYGFARKCNKPHSLVWHLSDERRKNCISPEWLLEYASGQPSFEQIATIEQHLAECDDCYGEVDFLYWTENNEFRPSVPRDLYSRIVSRACMQRIQEIYEARRAGKPIPVEKDPILYI